MNDFKFSYSPLKLDISNIDVLVNMAVQYRQNVGDALAVGFEKEVNLVCKIDFFPERKTLKDLREIVSNHPLYPYVKVYIDQAEMYGIKQISTFRCWIQGNDEKLPFQDIPILSAHTHPYGMPEDSSPTNTYTIVCPLRINTVEEYFWAKWIENAKDTIPLEWFEIEDRYKKIPGVLSSDFVKVKRNTAFMECWDNLRKNSPGEEVRAMLPKINEEMLVTFNSKNWLHGVDNVSSNLYFYMLFDDYTYE